MLKRLLVIPQLLALLTALPLQAWAISGIDPATGAQFSSPEEAADKSIALLRNLKPDKDDVRAKQLGFTSAVEAHDAERGAPLRVYIMHLDKLRQRQPENDPDDLLIDPDRVFYPLLVNGQVRSSLTVLKSADGWRTIRRGSSKTARRLAGFKTSTSNFLIWTPALNLILLGDRTGGKFTVIPIEDKYGLQAGNAIPASDAFDKLMKAAKNMDEDQEDEDDELGGAM